MSTTYRTAIHLLEEYKEKAESNAGVLNYITATLEVNDHDFTVMSIEMLVALQQQLAELMNVTNSYVTVYLQLGEQNIEVATELLADLNWMVSLNAQAAFELNARNERK